ncbi:MAG: fibronectin type III-like domain-contianing protein [Clostridia bacterium]|nr:fibronectin type III-like domain-contianing protein [Clostridia bacterium]
MTRPTKEFQGFARIFLTPGEIKKVCFILQPSQMAFLDEDMRWKIEKGEFEALPDLRGTLATPKGDIRFDYSPSGFTITLPKGMVGVFLHPDGYTVPLRSGTQTI